MSERLTSSIARSISGDSLYQKRARTALPILVRQAMASEKISYGDLAKELDMPNPRNLIQIGSKYFRTYAMHSLFVYKPILSVSSESRHALNTFHPSFQ